MGTTSNDGYDGYPDDEGQPEFETKMQEEYENMQGEDDM